ncbi:hypothetical protein EJ03DRAFT_325101 [Teratosphaeria nubilosa]|uniref:Cyclin N-terminal domain-containing protein n=1 Tax=Teratosphaeria nubilosa TaxID=161662 RepID=A0A6G1LG53_9PEZI|nr:hypothetical protein EJ03DRAFT_325101 [Teratosphaeria nubilosa]
MPGITGQGCLRTPDNIDIDALSYEELEALLDAVEATNGPLQKNKRFSLPAPFNTPKVVNEGGLDDEKKSGTTIEVTEISEDLLTDDDTVSSLDGEEFDGSQSSKGPSQSVAQDDDLDMFDRLTDEELDKYLASRAPLMTKRECFLNGPTKAELSAMGTDETWNSDTGKIAKKFPSADSCYGSSRRPVQDPVPDHVAARLVKQTWHGSTCLAYEAELARDLLKRFDRLPRPALAIAYNVLCAHNATERSAGTLRDTAPELLLIAAIALAMAYSEDYPPDNDCYSQFCNGKWSADQIDRATIGLFSRMGWTLAPYATPDAVASAMDKLLPPAVSSSSNNESEPVLSLLAETSIEQIVILGTACEEHWAHVKLQSAGSGATPEKSPAADDMHNGMSEGQKCFEY